MNNEGAHRKARELLKELIRRIIWILAVDDEYTAEPGTLKYRFLNWLYGPGEPEFDCTMPENL